jgi:hypothetical protein
MRRRSFSCLILVLVFPATIVAQVSTSRLQGTVLDQSGAVVPGAKIVALNNKLGTSAETTSNERGFYLFPSLLPGDYNVTVEKVGFRTAVHRGLVLAVSTTVDEPFKLEVGGPAETVGVQANVERVNTADPQIGFSVNLRDIDLLPQLDRNPMTLALSAPGVQVNSSAPAASRVNGLRQDSTNTKLDGIEVNDPVASGLLASMVFINPDSVGEFRMITSGAKAQYGRNAAGPIEMITRSGSKAWHGNAFDYLRNTILNANDFFANKTGLPKAKLIQNFFGGSIGGPVHRNRTFIFGNYQGQRIHRQSVPNRTVLTSEAGAGLFRWKDPQTGALRTFDIVANDPRKKGIDPKIAEQIKLLPLPNNYDVGDGLNSGGFRFNTPANTYQDQMTVRGDHTLTANHRLFYRHSWGRMWSIDSANSAEARYPGQVPGTQASHRWGNSFGSDWTIRPGLVNEFRFGRTDYSVAWERPARLPAPMFNNASWTPPLNPGFGQGRSAPLNLWTDNLTWLKGRHAVKAGGDVRLTSFGFSSDAGIWPNVSFGRNYGNIPSAVGPTTGISSADRGRFEQLYNDLLGRMSFVYQTFYSDLQKFLPAGTSRVRNWKFHDYGLFVQDDWKVRRNFVLNVGVRWEYFGPPHEADGLLGVLDKAAHISTASQIADFRVQRASAWYEPDRNNFAPRFGFAWDPEGKGKMSVRGSYGIFYDRTIGATASLDDGYTPGFAQQSNVFPNMAAGSDVRVSDGIPPPVKPDAPQAVLPLTRSMDTATFNPHLRTGYAQHFSLTIQRELFRNTIVDAAYVGTRGVKLFKWLNPNQPKTYGDFLDCFRQLQAWVADKTPVPASNTLVRIFGSPSAAVSALGGTTVFDQSLVFAALVPLDKDYNLRYEAAGVSQFYLLNFPQYAMLLYGTNDGRSYYDSLQLSLRRQTGGLKFGGNYTFSKTLDNGSNSGAAYEAPIDSFNLRLQRAIGDVDRRHSLNYAITYTLPVGRGRLLGARLPGWADRLLGGWDVGLLGLWQSGAPFSVTSGRNTTGGDMASYANYSGSRNIGEVMRKGDGVYHWTQEVNARFSFPKAGEIGDAGRNIFRGPRSFSMDMSLMKRFRTAERQSLVFVAQAYGLLNNPNFGLPAVNLTNPATLGKISSAIGARVFQFALRYEF